MLTASHFAPDKKGGVCSAVGLSQQPVTPSVRNTPYGKGALQLHMTSQTRLADLSMRLLLIWVVVASHHFDN